ncbi:hypothetical protein NE237_014258 [Protea cynaroides]|uniref:Uncharacterized protein n=1 Tax=Protea cynaroides TaxID=273540 RepID=A0A9Q0JTD9_9MAGN|nr:hypothetical protein NE237_014258 [Protea cynaroides]
MSLFMFGSMGMTPEHREKSSKGGSIPIRLRSRSSCSSSNTIHHFHQLCLEAEEMSRILVVEMEILIISLGMLYYFVSLQFAGLLGFLFGSLVILMNELLNE